MQATMPIFEPNMCQVGVADIRDYTVCILACTMYILACVMCALKTSKCACVRMCVWKTACIQRLQRTPEQPHVPVRTSRANSKKLPDDVFLCAYVVCMCL